MARNVNGNKHPLGMTFVMEASMNYYIVFHFERSDNSITSYSTEEMKAAPEAIKKTRKELQMEQPTFKELSSRYHLEMLD